MTGTGTPGAQQTQTAKDVRHHYTQVCHCEYADDDFTRVSTSADGCVVHGNIDDPLDSLLARLTTAETANEGLLDAVERLNATIDRLSDPRSQDPDFWRDEADAYLARAAAAEARVEALSEALRAAPMPIRESTLGDVQWPLVYDEWWHAHASEAALAVLDDMCRPECVCGHPFAPGHRTPGAECSVRGCECITYRARAALACPPQQRGEK